MIVEKGMTVQFGGGEYADEWYSAVYDVIKTFNTTDVVNKIEKEGGNSYDPTDWLVEYRYIERKKNHVHFDLGVSYLEDSESDFK